MYGNKPYLMKKNSLLSLVLLAVLATSASASQTESSSEPLALPTYAVESDRYVPAEEHVNRSLAALRAVANTPVTVAVELPALRTQLVRVVKAIAATRLAKS